MNQSHMKTNVIQFCLTHHFFLKYSRSMCFINSVETPRGTNPINLKNSTRSGSSQDISDDQHLISAGSKVYKVRGRFCWLEGVYKVVWK